MSIELCETCPVFELPEDDFPEARRILSLIQRGIYVDVEDYMTDHVLEEDIRQAVAACPLSRDGRECSQIVNKDYA